MNKLPFLLLFTQVAVFMLYGQQISLVDFKEAHTHITIDPLDEKVVGSVTYSFDIKQDTDTLFLDAVDMSFSTVHLNERKANFSTDGKKLYILDTFRSGETGSLEISYTAYPKKTVYFVGWDYPDAKKQIWTQGQGKETSHWLPSFNDVNEKVVYDLSISFDKRYAVVANGHLRERATAEGIYTWHYDMKEPMSSYLLAFAIGIYDKRTLRTEQGTPIELYYYPEDSLKVEPTYRYTQQIFDYFEKEIGVPYPWQNYKQVPVKDFLYSGMENTTTTLFSDRFVVDTTAFLDNNYVNVNAHELAHQWFGDMVTASSGTHHWLQEGFATYYALLAERELFGDDHFYAKLYQSAKQLQSLSEEGGESLLTTTASSLTYYQRGAWTLLMLRETVGDLVFRIGVKRYLNEHRFASATTEDLLQIMQDQSGKDLSEFKEKWLESPQFPIHDALLYLSLRSKVAYLLEQPRTPNRMEDIQREWWRLSQVPETEVVLSDAKSLLAYELAQKATANEDNMTLLREALEEDSLELERTVSASFDTIPPPLKPYFESFLSSKSYVAIENALWRLWLNYPEGRATYLDTTEGIEGLNNKNVRILWLALAIITSDFRDHRKPLYFEELSSYTYPSYHFEIRHNAFRYLRLLRIFSDQNLKDLLEACVHRVWYFARDSREMLDALLKDLEYKERLLAVEGQVSTRAANYLQRKIEEE